MRALPNPPVAPDKLGEDVSEGLNDQRAVLLDGPLPFFAAVWYMRQDNQDIDGGTHGWPALAPSSRLRRTVRV